MIPLDSSTVVAFLFPQLGLQRHGFSTNTEICHLLGNPLIYPPPHRRTRLLFCLTTATTFVRNSASNSTPPYSCVFIDVPFPIFVYYERDKKKTEKIPSIHSSTTAYSSVPSVYVRLSFVRPAFLLPNPIISVQRKSTLLEDGTVSIKPHIFSILIAWFYLIFPTNLSFFFRRSSFSSFSFS